MDSRVIDIRKVVDMQSRCRNRQRCRRWFASAICSSVLLLVAQSALYAQTDAVSPQIRFVIEDVEKLVLQLSADSFKKRVDAQKQLSEIAGRFPHELGNMVPDVDPETQLRLVRILEQVFLSRTDEAADAAEQSLDAIRHSQAACATDADAVLIGNSRLRESRARHKIEQLGGRLAYAIPIESRAGLTAPRVGVGFGEQLVLQIILISEDWSGTPADLWQLRRLSHHRNLLLYNIRSNHLSLSDLMALGDDLPGLIVSERGACLGIRGNNSPSGMRISEIVPNSPAEAADLRPEDEVKYLDEHEVRNFSHLVELLLSYSPGNIITLKVIREGRLIDVPVTLASWRHMPLAEVGYEGVPSDFAGPLGQGRPIPPALPEKVRPEPRLRFSME